MSDTPKYVSMSANVEVDVNGQLGQTQKTQKNDLHLKLMEMRKRFQQMQEIMKRQKQNQ